MSPHPFFILLPIFSTECTEQYSAAQHGMNEQTSMIFETRLNPTRDKKRRFPDNRGVVARKTKMGFPHITPNSMHGQYLVVPAAVHAFIVHVQYCVYFCLALCGRGLRRRRGTCAKNQETRIKARKLVLCLHSNSIRRVILHAPSPFF